MTATSLKSFDPAKATKRGEAVSVAHAPMTLTIYLAFAAIYVLWGSTYLAMRIGIETIPPLLLVGTRHLVTGLILYPFLRVRTGIRPSAAHWGTAAVTGILLLFVGNGGVCWAEQFVPSGLTALLVGMVALWLVWFWWLRPGGTRPTGRVAAGSVLGFGGLVLLGGPARLGGSGRVRPLGAGVLGIAPVRLGFGFFYSHHLKNPRSAPSVRAL